MDISLELDAVYAVPGHCIAFSAFLGLGQPDAG